MLDPKWNLESLVEYGGSDRLGSATSRGLSQDLLHALALERSGQTNERYQFQQRRKSVCKVLPSFRDYRG